jgi:hypothetical protein
LELINATFKNKKVKSIIFNYIITLKLEINIFYKLGHSNINKKITIMEILKYLFIFNYWDVRRFYIFKYIKLLELLIIPKKLCKIIELSY